MQRPEVASAKREPEPVAIDLHLQLTRITGLSVSGYKAREKLIAAGILRPGHGGLTGWEPRPARPDVPPLSAVLAEMRDEDDR